MVFDYTPATFVAGNLCFEEIKLKTEMVYIIAGVIVAILCIGWIQSRRRNALLVLTKYRRLASLENKILRMQSEILSWLPELIQRDGVSADISNPVYVAERNAMRLRLLTILENYNKCVADYNSETQEALHAFCRKTGLPNEGSQTLRYSFRGIDLGT